MKKILTLVAMAVAAVPAFAQNNLLLNNADVATPVFDGLWHAPNYMPQYPTAATLWPRVVEVPCKTVAAGAALDCGVVTWTPAFEGGRGEYVYLKPVAYPAPIIKEVPVYREVPKKKAKE